MTTAEVPYPRRARAGLRVAASVAFFGIVAANPAVALVACESASPSAVRDGRGRPTAAAVTGAPPPEGPISTTVAPEGGPGEVGTGDDVDAPDGRRASATPTRFDLREGESVDIGAGVTVELKSVLYSHLSGSRNGSLLTLDVRRGAEQKTVTLQRTDPVGTAGPPYRAMLGRRVAIDYVDAYRRPSTAAILVLPE
jgi:hypothetical protein